MKNFEKADWSALPVPRDDGATDHLTGLALPAISLPATNDTMVDLSKLEGTSVVYIYPRTGKPGQDLPTGWDAIPGARGCTPQSCAFRDLAAELKQAGAANLFGLSVQTTPYQREVAERLHLPFALLSDENFVFCDVLKLPTFVADGMRLNNRMTLIITQGTIKKVFYPVFPPDENANAVIDWLTKNQT